MSGPVKRRRRGGSVCANPLFVRWVEELRDDCKERGLKSYHTYTKALNSLKKYPLPLQSGEEAKILDHVGDKLANILDKKLSEHGAGSSSDGELDGDFTTASSAQETTTSKGKKKTSKAPGSVHPVAKKKSSAREYVPAYRSGPYALIISLYNAKEKPSWRGFLHKAELIADAQHLCDVSFTVPDPGSYYTAWSSMSTIIRKGLVQKISNPPKFSLTEHGKTMALQLLQGSCFNTTSTSSNQQPSQNSASPSTSTSHSVPSRKRKRGTPQEPANPPSPLSVPSKSPSPAPVHISYVDSPPSCVPSISSEEEDGSDLDNQAIGARESGLGYSIVGPSSSALKFWYVDHNGQAVLQKDSAAVTFNDIMSAGFLVKCRASDLEAANVVYSLDKFREMDGPFVYAYLGDLDTPEQANPPDQLSSSASASSSSNPTTSVVMETPPATANNAASASRIVEGRSQLATTTVVMETPPATASNAASANRIVGGPQLGYDRKDPPTGLITLSDSDDDRDVLPLMSRVRPHPSGEMGDERAATNTSTRGRGREGPLTPAGRAALLRWNSNKRNTEDHKVVPEDSVPVVLPDVGASKGSRPQASRANLPRPQASRANQLRPQASRANPQGGEGSRPQASRANLQGGEGSRPQANEVCVDTGDPEFVLTPGNFEVVLIVDSAESTASRKSSSQFRGILLQELGKNGVSFDVRRLSVGDFTWVAREKSLPKPGCLSLPKSREVVLEYIVERKRMDDLAGSIIDGRFNEQKFRLRNSGVLHPVYLVEEHDSTHCKIDLCTLNQAVANTQIVDGFYVKRTKDIRESVAYLTIFTRSLQLAYGGKTVKAFSCDAVTELNKGKQQHTWDLTSRVVCGIEFTKFNEASVKNKALTVREMFGRHLMQLPGLSADKAAVILGEYPTLEKGTLASRNLPQFLIKEYLRLRTAYSQCTSQADRIKLVAELRYGHTKRRMGPALSHLLYSVYYE